MRLSEKEKRKLIRRAQKGDTVARNELIESDMALIISLADRLWKKTSLSWKLDRDDLIQAGVLGYVRAVEKFDFDADVKISTYAFWWLRSKMNRCIAKTYLNQKAICYTDLSANDVIIEDQVVWDDCEEIDKKDMIEHVRSVIPRLPPLLRKIIRLTLTGKTHAEIRKTTGLPRSTVYKYHNDAIQELRIYMGLMERPTRPEGAPKRLAAAWDRRHMI